MSVLIHESAINPDKNLWALAGASNGGSAKCITGSSTGSTYTLTQNVLTSLNTAVSTQPVSGTFVIMATFQYDPKQATNYIFTGTLTDTVSGAGTTCDVSDTTGNLRSLSCVLTIPNATSINVTQYGTSTLANATVKGQWTVLFFPS